MRQGGGDTPQLQSTTAYLSNQYEPQPTIANFEPQAEELATGDFGGCASMGGHSPMMLTAADVMPRSTFSIQPTGKFAMAIRALRVVQQYLTDRNDNIPLEKRVLYKGNEFLTDLSDDELRYNVPVMDLLRAHNEYRVTVRDKAYKDKEVFLEEARPGELCLTTVTLAAI